ncbi:MAG TPA: Uma2 family endonuclease [Pyrinomonadaceae bacterium]|jgi:Uma2 family endonuclease
MTSVLQDLLKLDVIQHSEIVVKLRPDEPMDDDEFFDFCQKFDNERIEQTADGEIIIMPPTGFETSNRNAEIVTQLRIWAKKDGSGLVTESNGEYVLPNGAKRAPDAAWILKSRVEKISKKRREKFLPLCPDFVVELMSPSDRLKDVQEKMREYVENGAGLGWLINPKEKEVHVYRPNAEIEILKNPQTVSGENMLPGFELDLTEIW